MISTLHVYRANLQYSTKPLGLDQFVTLWVVVVDVAGADGTQATQSVEADLQVAPTKLQKQPKLKVNCPQT